MNYYQFGNDENYYNNSNNDYMPSSEPLMKILREYPEDDGVFNEKKYMPYVQQISDIFKDAIDKLRVRILSTPDERTGYLPYVYAYLHNKKSAMFFMIDNYIPDYSVLNAVDIFNYTIMDYAIENKDIQTIKWIHDHGGKPSAYTYLLDDYIEEEQINPHLHVHNVVPKSFTNNNYKKIIKTLKKSNKGPIRGFHGTTIVPRSTRIPSTSKKVTTTNKEIYNTQIFLKHKYTPTKNIIIPTNLSTLDSWIARQTAYIHKTPRREYIVRSYTHHGDVMVNKLLRGQLFEVTTIATYLHEHIREIIASIIKNKKATIPFLYQVYDMYDTIFTGMNNSGTPYPAKDTFGTEDNLLNTFTDFCKQHMDIITRHDIIEQLLRKYAEELDDIIRNAPRLPHSIKTYRGASDEYHIPKGAREYTHDGFTSTSLSPATGFNFSRIIYPTVRCCIYEMTIPKSLPVIYLEGATVHEKEYEVLLPLNIRVEASNKMILKRLHGYTERALVREVTVKGIHRASPSMRLTKHSSLTRKLRFKPSRSRHSTVHKEREPAGGAGRGTP